MDEIDELIELENGNFNEIKFESDFSSENEDESEMAHKKYKKDAKILDESTKTNVDLIESTTNKDIEVIDFECSSEAEIVNKQEITTKFESTEEHFDDKQIISTVETDTIYNCLLCRYFSVDVENLLLHVKTHGNSKGSTPFNCRVCDFSTHIYTSFYKHVLWHEEVPLHCSFCNFNASTKTGLIDHEKLIHMKEDFYVCPLCNFTTTHSENKKSNLRQHMSMVHGLFFQIPCKHCPFKGNTNKSIKDHMWKHHRDLFKCNHCLYTDILESMLVFHTLKVHLSCWKKYKCDFCNFVCHKEEALTFHVNMKHNTPINTKHKTSVKVTSERKTTYSCNRCDNFTAHSYYLLNKHKSAVHAEKLYTCEDCFFETFSHMKYIKHRQKHIFLRCKKCSFTTDSQDTLNEHEKTHVLQHCTVCDYSTSHKRRFEAHMSSHSFCTSFKCNECEFSSTTESDLATHIKEHAKQYTYLCKKCSHGFFDKEIFINHVEETHKLEALPCCFCEYVAIMKNEFMQHKKTHIATDHNS